MARESDVRKFILAVGVHFPPLAKGEEAEVWVASMVHVLARMEPEVLAAAAKLIIETRSPKTDGKWFPTPSECIAACNRARDRIAHERSAAAPMLSHGEGDKSPWATWRIERADEFIRTTALGKQAADEGWTLALHDFIREHVRLPSDSEVGDLKASAEGHKRLVGECERGEAGALSDPLARLGRSMLERGRDMAAFVGGKGPATWRR